MYFSANLTKEQAKKLFRKLAVELHPDKGGDQLSFVRMQREYESFLVGSFDYTRKDAQTESSALTDFINANEFVKTFEDVVVELTGTWVWLSGNTKPYKETIKEHGFRWSKSKSKWYKAPQGFSPKKGKYRGTNFAKIQDRYGYSAQTMKGQAKLA